MATGQDSAARERMFEIASWAGASLGVVVRVGILLSFLLASASPGDVASAIMP